MTSEQLAAVKVGDVVVLRGDWGQVSQTTPSWFMVTWCDREIPEMFKREQSWLTDLMELMA